MSDPRQARGAVLLSGRRYGNDLNGQPVVRQRILQDGKIIEETFGLDYYGGGSDPDLAEDN